MRYLCCTFAVLTLAACGSHGDEPRAPTCAGELALPPLEAPPPATGKIFGSAEGTFTTNLRGRATTYQTGTTGAAYTAIDGYNTDAQHRPTGELFLFLRGSAKVSQSDFVPVTLDELKNADFFPTGSIAAYAEAYDSAAKDYTRWLVAQSGCVRIAAVTPGSPGQLEAFTIFTGEWRSNTGTLLGQGSASAIIESPLLDLRQGIGSSDAMTASVTGQRPKPFSAPTLEAYQVLHPWQTRLVIVGIQPADTTRELWLSIAGIPRSGDSIGLGAVSLAEASAGRTDPTRSFAMLRMLGLEGTQPVVREIWRSTTGWVKFTTVVQNGALALCGAVSGTFSVSTQGVSLAAPTTDLGTTLVSEGSFTSRMTIVSQSDTLIDPASVAPSAIAFRPASPASTMGFRCQ